MNDNPNRQFVYVELFNDENNVDSDEFEKFLKFFFKELRYNDEMPNSGIMESGAMLQIKQKSYMLCFTYKNDFDIHKKAVSDACNSLKRKYGFFKLDTFILSSGEKFSSSDLIYTEY